MSFVLYIVALILKAMFACIGYVVGVIVSLYRHEFKQYHLKLAISIDQYGNALCQYLFNLILIKPTGYKFGNVDETISSVIGKNKMSNNLTKLGMLLDICLNLLDNNHSIDSIDNTVNGK